jgi:1,2-diacylglycerol-3-alpha-glucose alpha-1,2-glucosyltransferase
MKICLYLEFLHFKKGILFKDIGTGLLSSYKNQKRMLEEMGIEYTEHWSDDCDILQTNTPWIKSLYLMKKAKRMNKPVIVWAHVTAEDMRGVFRFSSIFAPLMKSYLRYSYNQADIIFCPSEYTRGLVIAYGINPNKVIAQSNGVDLKKYYKDEAKREAGRKYFGVEGMVVGTVALAIPRKGIKTFIFLAQKFQTNAFLWIGKIYNGALVEKLPKDLPMNLNFSGFVPDALEAFNSLDIFVFLSYEENQGMVILEAAALGLPMLLRDIPVYNGWLVHGENCLKAKTDEEFERELKRLMEDKDLRDRLSRGALELAQKESLESLKIKLSTIYKGVI